MTKRNLSNATIGCMATFPARFGIIKDVVDRIAPHLDHLFIYVNETTAGFPDVSHRNVTVLDGREHAGDLSANGKIYPLRFTKNCRVLIFDDDFLFPSDYVSRNLRYLQLFDGRCVVTTHGGILPARVDWYYERTKVMASRYAVGSLQMCNLAGSGTICFDQRHLDVDPEEFLSEVWVDLKLSLLARDRGLPIWVLPRHENWLEPIPTPGLWEKFRTQGLTHHTFYARDVDWSFSIYRDIANTALRQAGLSPEDIGLDTELAIGLETGVAPNSWRSGVGTMKKRREYLSLLLKQGSPAS